MVTKSSFTIQIPTIEATPDAAAPLASGMRGSPFIRNRILNTTVFEKRNSQLEAISL